MRRVRVDRYLDVLLGRLLPPRCVLCGQPGQPPVLDLCAECEAALLPDPAPLRSGPDPVDRCFAPFAYGFPMDHLVHLLKYRRRLAVGRVLGRLVAGPVRDLGLHLDVDWLVPVPLHPRRHAERGFNQSAEIARWVARGLGCRCNERAILRVEATRPQVGLGPEERRGNLRGAFRAAAGLRGLRVAVLDDVVTTGATAAAVAVALLEGGARSVDVWCLARAAAPDRLDWQSEPEANPS